MNIYEEEPNQLPDYDPHWHLSSPPTENEEEYFVHVEANQEQGQKFDSEKPRMDLIPPTAEHLLAEVLTHGAQKYAPNNWRKVPDAETRYIAAAMRHINAYRSGEHLDEESGLPHLAHAMCCLAFILELQYE